MNKKLIISIVVIVAAILGFWWFLQSPANAPSETPTPGLSVSVLPTPTATATSSPAITINSPLSQATVDSPIVVTGRARIFENQLTVYVKTLDGQVITQQHVYTDAKESGQYGTFRAQLSVPGGAPKDVKIEASSLSAKGDGTYEGFASITVHLKTTEISSVYVAFLTNSSDCTNTTLFPRPVIKSSQFTLASILELLKGPYNFGSESVQHASTQIPDGTQVNSLKQTGDTIKVDFNGFLNAGVAGSCRVQAIRAQITNTLKQFLGVNNVIISINGKTEGILEP